LLAISPDVMLAAHARLVDELAQTSDPAKFGQAAASAMPFQPTYGTSFLPQRPIDAVAAGSAADIDVMVGTTREEALIFIVDLTDVFNEALVEATLDVSMNPVGRAGSDVLAVYRSNRPDAEPHELAAAAETDRMFRIPAIRLAEAQSQHNPNSWMYRFDWRSTTRGGEFGACHLLEVPFAFDRLDNDQGGEHRTGDQRVTFNAPYRARSSASLRSPPMMPPSILFIM
jgi:para-nitrobenzyl esterase